MAYNTTWMENATTLSDAFVGGLTQQTTGSTLAVSSVGLIILVAAYLIMLIRLSGNGFAKSMVISGFTCLIFGLLFTILGVYAIYWNGIFLVSIVAGFMIRAFGGE